MNKNRPAIKICVSHGNSYIKSALYAGKSQKAFFRLESKIPPSVKAYLSELIKIFDYSKIPDPGRVTLALSATRKDAGTLFQKICAKTGFRFLSVSCGLELPVKIDYLPPESLGTDRICAAAAAFEKYRGEADNIVVIDFGTATTFNLISAGVFRGGLILPGFGLYKNSLGDSCDYLYRVRFNRIAGFLCRDTESSLIAGIYGGYPVLVGGLYRKLLHDARLDEKKTCLVITGGYANFFTTLLECPVICDQSLVLDGINLIAGLNSV